MNTFKLILKALLNFFGFAAISPVARAESTWYQENLIIPRSYQCTPATVYPNILCRCADVPEKPADF